MIVQINIDNGVLEEAEKALNAIGMDVQIAINVFLRRVAIEKGLPMAMTAPIPDKKDTVIENRSNEDGNQVYLTRSNNTITEDMVEKVWQAFTKYHAGLGEISSLSDEVAKSSGMSRGSAFIYLNILANLIKGEPNTRNLKMLDLEYFMKKIKLEMGSNEYQNAISSLEKSIPYWHKKLPGAFADKVQGFLKKESDIDFK